MWPADVAWLESSAVQFLSANRWHKQQWWPEFWDTPAIALRLSEASEGLPKFQRLQGQGIKALAALKTEKRRSPHRVKTQQFLYQFIFQVCLESKLVHTAFVLGGLGGYIVAHSDMQDLTVGVQKHPVAKEAARGYGNN